MKKNINLTEGSILKNLVYLSLPIMLANFMGTLYNLVDTYWVGKIAEGAKDAVAVTGMAFPISFFIMAFASGFTVAGTAIVAKFKGQGDLTKIKMTVGQFMPILLGFTIIFSVVTHLALPSLLRFLHTPPEIYADALMYITYVMYGMIAMMFFMVFQSFTTGFGDSVTPMTVQIIAVVLNMILDPLLIFGVGFFPELGLKGAAFATLISRVTGTILAFIIFYKKYNEYIPSFSDMIPKKEAMRNIFKISIPASIGQSTTSFGFILMQGLVNSFGTSVISANSIGNRMMGIFMLPAMGVSNALATVVGQNLGAGKDHRATKSVHYAMLLVMSIMTIGCVYVYFFGSSLTEFFVKDVEVQIIGERMFKISAYATWVFGILMVFMGVFNGAGHTKSTLIFNISRLWAFRIPTAYLLSGYFFNKDLGIFQFAEGTILYLGNILNPYQYEALWWSMVFSNSAAVVIAIIIYMKGNWKVSQAGW